MRIALISDIHGEVFPLEVVLNDMNREHVDKIACLGDAVQGGSHPKETIAKLREFEIPVVMGNADSWLVTGETTNKDEEVSEKQREVRAWSLSQLSKEDIDYVKGFRPTIEIPLDEGRKLLCFHGSPGSFNDAILPSTSDADVREFFQGFEGSFFAGGHTHTQQVRRLQRGWYVNPGSVSLAYNWNLSNFNTEKVTLDPWGDYCIITSERDRIGVTFRHVPYDFRKLAEIIRSSGRPHAEDTISSYEISGI